MPVAKIFYGELRSNEETDQTRQRVQVSWWGNIGCLRLHFERFEGDMIRKQAAISETWIFRKMFALQN